MLHYFWSVTMAGSISVFEALKSAFLHTKNPLLYNPRLYKTIDSSILLYNCLQTSIHTLSTVFLHSLCAAIYNQRMLLNLVLFI